MKTYYTCVVYDGSCCMCGAYRYTENECGHKHRTKEAAERCLDKLQGRLAEGTGIVYSADWYDGKIVERAYKNKCDILTLHTGQRINAAEACEC